MEYAYNAYKIAEGLGVLPRLPEFFRIPSWCEELLNRTVGLIGVMSDYNFDEIPFIGPYAKEPVINVVDLNGEVEKYEASERAKGNAISYSYAQPF
jgi:hypothetical protein